VPKKEPNGPLQLSLMPVLRPATFPPATERELIDALADLLLSLAATPALMEKEQTDERQDHE